MLRRFLFTALVTFSISLISCETCHTCVYTEDDGSTRETEVCGYGKVHNNTLDTYERSNWTCTEN